MNLNTLATLAIAWACSAPLALSASPRETDPRGFPDEALFEAFQAARHAFKKREDGVHIARNPGQSWWAEFDGHGFLVRPDHGQWDWGMELTAVNGSKGFVQPRVVMCGNRLTYDWNENIEEWFLNDQRGLEQGWTIHSRIENNSRAEPSTSLAAGTSSSGMTLILGLRGSLQPRISADQRSVVFQTIAGSPALTYGGLKAWDANNNSLGVRFTPGPDEATLAIHLDDAEATYPITIDPLVQQAYLKASNTGERDRFGAAVAISGDTVVVGSPREDSGATGVNGSQADAPDPFALDPNREFDSGAVYVFVRNGDVWTQQAYLKPHNTDCEDHFGHAVAISGDIVVVGAWREESAATGVNGDGNDNSLAAAGAAYVFVRSGTSWSQDGYLKASNTGVADAFGYSVAVSGDTVVVGAPVEDSDATGVNGSQGDGPNPEPGDSTNRFDSGAAYVFVRGPIGAAAWIQQAYLKASNTGIDDRFGLSVAISGDTVVVGAPWEASAATGVNADGDDNSAERAGAAYVFVRSGDTWAHEAYLKSSNAGSFDWFGRSVAISGELAVVGAPVESSAATGVDGDGSDNSAGASGAAYVFARSGTTWSQETYLKASNTDAKDRFGETVAISGNLVVAGAWCEDSAATGVNADESSNGSDQSGAAYLFVRSSSGTWIPRTYLKASNTGIWDRFGISVGVSGTTVVVGAEGEDSSASGVNQNQTNNAAPEAGAAYVFKSVAPDIGPVGPELVLEKPRTIYWTHELPYFDFGPLREEEVDTVAIEIRNTGQFDLTGLAVGLNGENPTSFRVIGGPEQTLPAGEPTTITVEYAPPGPGDHLASLDLTGFNVDGSRFTLTIMLNGTALSSTDDTDGDGMTDAAELLLRDLGFDWQVNQQALVDTYYTNAIQAGLFSAEQVHALHAPAPVLSRDSDTGRFLFTMDWQQSTDLRNFFDFPLTDVDLSVNAAGDLEVEFESEADAMFFRVELK